MRSTAEQRAKAILSVSKAGNDNVGEAFKDNVVLDYAGVRATELTAAQRQQLLALVGAYVGNLRDGQARVQMSDVRAPPRRHLLRVDRRHRAGQRLLLPHPQPGCGCGRSEDAVLAAADPREVGVVEVGPDVLICTRAWSSRRLPHVLGDERQAAAAGRAPLSSAPARPR